MILGGLSDITGQCPRSPGFYPNRTWPVEGEMSDTVRTVNRRLTGPSEIFSRDTHAVKSLIIS
jgi:hypothetical protein